MNDKIGAALLNSGIADVIGMTAIRLGMTLEILPKSVQMETIAMLISRLHLKDSVNEMLELAKEYDDLALEGNREAK